MAIKNFLEKKCVKNLCEDIMVRVVHYVGMDEDTYRRARRVWGGPAYYHKWNDARVDSEVSENDIVVYGDTTYRQWVWDASAVDRSYTE